MIRIEDANQTGWDSIDEYYHYDVQRIIDAGLKNGYIINPKEAYDAWSQYSDIFAAGWLFMPDNIDELWSDVAPYLKEERV